jgi:cytidylate kinase
VRAALLDFQRSFAAEPPGGTRGAVLDGRDIGTVVCPDAESKLFVTASPEVRAERRYLELRERGLDAIHGRVLADMKERDARDSERTVSPLEPAKDAFLLDTSDLDADQVFAAALDFINGNN